jgi:hypothetical protein
MVWLLLLLVGGAIKEAEQVLHDHTYCRVRTVDTGIQCSLTVATDHNYRSDSGISFGSQFKCNTAHKGTQCTFEIEDTEELQYNGALVVELKQHISNLQQRLDMSEESINKLNGDITILQNQLDNFKSERLVNNNHFSVACVMKHQQKQKKQLLFKFYTGIEYKRFVALFDFLHPSNFSLQYENGREDIKKLNPVDCLFIMLCRLRHNFCLQDLAYRFGLTLRSVSVVFNSWVNHMYFKFGQLSIWPHRNTIIGKMPKQFCKDFPKSIAIIDATELRTETPCALALQSRLYSNYKSSNTLKGLVACDPNGTLLFVSKLFTGSISDNELTRQSGFLDVLKDLLSIEFLNEGDAIMADKGFTIHDDLQKLNLELNIPPFTSSTQQMTKAETEKTQKIAKHRIHIERLIAKIKKYKIVSNRIPTNMFSSIDKIWTICCFLTMFDDIFVT